MMNDERWIGSTKNRTHLTTNNMTNSLIISTAKQLYLEHNGLDHRLIEKEMRRLGCLTFTRRVFYTKKTPKGPRMGWIEKYNWKDELRARCESRLQPALGEKDITAETQRRGGTTGGNAGSPPARGGVDAEGGRGGGSRERACANPRANTPKGGTQNA